MKLIYKYKLIIIFLLTLVAITSVFKAFIDAQVISFDFHFSPAKLVSEGINHYQYILEGNHDHGPNDKIMYEQNGVYAQGLFVLLLPLTYLDWDQAKLVWSLINITIGILLPILICKKFSLNKFETFMVTSIFLSSTIFRIHIGYGQQTLLSYLFFIFPFLFNSKLSSIFSGISYFKFNIGYVLFFYFLSELNFKKLVLSILPLVAGWLLYSFITDTNIFINLFEPLKLILYWDSDKAFPVTIFSLLKKFNFPNLSVLIIPLIINFILIIKIKHIKDNLLKLSLISLSAICFMPHQLHDYVLLLPLLIYSVKNFNLFLSKINLLFVFYFFFILRIVSFFFNIQPWEFPYNLWGYFNNLICLIILSYNYLLLKKNIIN
mgnify:FL=1